jgi:acyl transferase domain-containing protein
MCTPGPGERIDPAPYLKDITGKVAVIGIGCRFPGAGSPEEFWRMLAEGRCATRPLPEGREKLDFRRNTDKKHICGYIDGIDLFDPLFFGVTPREAGRLDPQHRLMLEALWEALEDAGITAKELAGSNTGVFTGTGETPSSSHYFMRQIEDKTADIYSLTGCESFALANRISYTFDFRGPCFSISSACSTSMLAVNEACMRIRGGECEVAVAGGSNLLQSSDITEIFQNARLLACDGRCKAFDEKADGYVRGEGAGVVILKSLEKALQDGDNILAVVSGMATNHGGRNGRGFTYPNAGAHTALMKAAFKDAGVSPGELCYIEAHGTGTPVGDEIELAGLKAALSEGRADGDYCMIGSVKSNIGHLEYAAGMASFIKTCLILKEKKLPPSLHFTRFGRNIDEESLPVRVNTELRPWPEGKKLIAGVSSFGLGGTNAHAVLEGIENFLPARCAPDKIPEPPVRAGGYVFPVSGHNELALKGNAGNYLEFIKTAPQASLGDLCYCAGVKKDHFGYRAAITCETLRALQSGLEALLGGKDDAGVFYQEGVPGKSEEAVFVFSDSPEGWLTDDLRELFNAPVFSETLQEADTEFIKLTGNSLRDYLDSEPAPTPNGRETEDNALYFAFQLALCREWENNGVGPTRLAGYGQGEVAAAYLAGMLTRGEALRTIIDRTRLQQAAREAVRSLHVMASPEDIGGLLADCGNVAIAAINSPSSLTISGPARDMDEVSQKLAVEGYSCRYLPAGKNSRVFAGGGERSDLRPDILTRTGGPITPIYTTAADARGEYRELCAAYWENHTTGVIDFYGRISEMIADNCDRFIEIGDGSALSFYIYDAWNQCCEAAGGRDIAIISSVRKKIPFYKNIMAGIAELYSAGYPVKWKQIYKGGAFIKTPHYAWQRSSYWV